MILWSSNTYKVYGGQLGEGEVPLVNHSLLFICLFLTYSSSFVFLLLYLSSFLLLRKRYIYYTDASTQRNAFTSISFLWVIPFWNANITANGHTLKIHYQFIPRLDEFIKSFSVGYPDKAAPYMWCVKDQEKKKNGKRGSRVALCQGRGDNSASTLYRVLVWLPLETTMDIKHIKNIPTFLVREKQIEIIACHFIKIKQKHIR